MPVSGHEETGVKSFAGQFSGLIASVPIKKRRLPLIQPFSPLSGEQYSLTEETESLRKEHSSTPQGSTLSNSSIADAPIKKRRFPLIQTSSSSLEESSTLPEENNASRKEQSSTTQDSILSSNSGDVSDTDKISAFEGRKASSDVTNDNLVRSNSNYLIPKLEEPKFATHSSTLDVMDSKEKMIISESSEEKLGPQMMKENPELLLAAKESLALNIGADISKQNVEEKCKQESPAVPESTNLSLGFKQHLFPAVSSFDIDESFQKTEKAESVSLKLSLSKEEGSSKSSKDDAKTNRANWDLNTTMDAWEESGSDAASGKTSVRGLQIDGNTLNQKNATFSTGVGQTGITSLKHTNAETQNKAFTSSKLYGQQCKCVDPRNLCLASCLQKNTAEPSRLSDRQNSECAIRTLSLSNLLAAGDVNIASVRRVKSEPLDENMKQDLKEAKPCSVGSFDGVTVKHELIERSNIESVKSTEGSNLKLFDPKFIKSEPGHENNRERPKTTESISDQMDIELPQRSDNCSSIEKPATLESVPISAETACPPVKDICSAEMSTGVSIVKHLENHASTEGACVDDKASKAASSSNEQFLPETDAIAMVDNAAESSSPGMKNSICKEENADDPEGCKLKLMNELPSDPQGSGEVSDDEKITLSADMLEDDSYCFDYESDGTNSLTVAMDIEQYDGEDDDYEDGEVREPLKHSVIEDPICEVREVEHIASSNYDSKQIEKGVVSGDCPTASHIEENDNRTVTHSEINCDKDVADTESNVKSDNVADKIVCIQESLEAEKTTVGSHTRSLDLSERKSVHKTSEAEVLYDQGTNERHEVDVTQYADEVVKNLDVVTKTDSDLPKMEVSVNTDDATKDVSNGGNQGRIINLSRAASSSSPTKSRSISSRGLPSRAGRDLLSDAFHHDKLHGGRDELYIDGPCKFSRERHQDMSPRHSRLNFMRGRGRVNSRIDARRGEWESDREFGGEFYNGPSHFRAPRHKFASAVHDADPEYNNVAHDGSFVGVNRVGRKPLNDEGPVGHHITSRRRSPVGRESMQVGHRIPRTMSPSRCVGDDGSEFVSMRHGEKFMRGFPEDPVDPMFSRPQPFDRLDGRFTRRTRNFSIQGRGPPRIHSKSPIRSRSRSPGPWSSPRRKSPRRSPDGFGGRPELAHRRSPLYRVDRMRSPDRPVFPGDRVVRRHVSPSYMSRPSNDIRDIDSGRGRGHPRSVISNRSPSGRILLRNRRFDVVDHQDRADNDEYFGGPMHSGRLLELNGEGNGDERRRFGERRGPVRSFRASYNSSVGENFHLDAEDGPRHYRFCADDSEFHERSSLRERDFDRRIKGRPANVPPRRTRNIDEQEANYRNSGQVWSDDGFDDISRVKRKRF